MVAILAVPRGRWAAEFEAQRAPASSAAERNQCFDVAWARAVDSVDKHKLPLTLTHSAGQLPTLVGFAIVRSWSMFTGGAVNSQAELMMRLLQRNHQRSQWIQFVLHRFHAAALVDCPAPCAEGVQSERTLPFECKRLVADARFHELDGGSRTVHHGLQNLTDFWGKRFSIEDVVYTWPLWWPLAQLVVAGHWVSDVTVMLARSGARAWVPPVMPSRRKQQGVKKRRAACAPDSEAAGPAAESCAGPDPATSASGGLAGKPILSPDLRIRALLASQHLKSQRQAQKSMDHYVSFICSDSGDLRKQVQQRNLRMPKKDSLCRARPRFDIAAMMANRELYRRNGPYFRYIAFDASPQNCESTEIFVSVERVVQRASAVGKDFASFRAEDIQRRTLPLTTLGQGKTDLASKVMAQDALGET